MAGKYYTATVEQDYLHDVKQTGTAPSLTSTEKDRADRFASAWVDQVFVDYDRAAWDETASPAGTAPPVIKEIAAAVCGSVIHRVLSVRNHYDHAEEDSSAARLFAYAKMLVEEILEGNGVIVNADGTEQHAKMGRGKTGMMVSRATYDSILSDHVLNRFAYDVAVENSHLRAPDFDYSLYYWN